MTDLVQRQLGAATARLHERLLAALEVATAARPALLRLVGDTLCGAFHDHLSARPEPKAALLAALRAVPEDAQAGAMLAALIEEVSAGAFADGDEEARRRRARYAPPPAPEPENPPAPAQQPPAPPLNQRQRAVLAWLAGYHVEHGRSPTAKQIADGLGLDARKVSSTLQQLERRGAVVRGSRLSDGWIPKRSP